LSTSPTYEAPTFPQSKINSRIFDRSLPQESCANLPEKDAGFLRSCMTALIFPPIGHPRLALFLLIFFVTACRGSSPEEQAMTETGASKKPALISPLVSDVDEKNVLYSGQSLWAGGFGLVLEHGRDTFGARLTENGAFILYNASGVLWTAKGNDKAPGYELIMQDDGNLVLYNQEFQPVWASETHAYFGGEKYRTADWKPVKLVLEPNLLVLYSATGRRVWSNQAGEISASR